VATKIAPELIKYSFVPHHFITILEMKDTIFSINPLVCNDVSLKVFKITLIKAQQNNTIVKIVI